MYVSSVFLTVSLIFAIVCLRNPFCWIDSGISLGFNFIFLMNNEIEHIFTFLLAFAYPCVCEVPSKPFARILLSVCLFY